MNSKPENSIQEWQVGNYCVNFIDVLGQRDVLKGQGLLPLFDSKEQHKKLNELLRKSIGPIIYLQKLTDDVMSQYLKFNPDSPLREKLTPEQQTEWDEMQRVRLVTQRWSDGLVTFTCLGDTDIKCNMNAVFGMFALAGIQCLSCLSRGYSIRGAIEIAWGAELHPGELYGAAIARAYELESEIAQYPRIVVGPEAIRFIELQTQTPNQDPFSQYQRELASLCLQFLTVDADGNVILHYLGDEFRKSVMDNNQALLHDAAKRYIYDQLLLHQENRNTTLVLRYLHLLQYFESHQPAKADE